MNKMNKYFSAWALVYRPTRSSMYRRAVEELMPTCSNMHRRMATVFCWYRHKLCHDVQLPRTRRPIVTIVHYCTVFTAEAAPVGLWRLSIGLLMGSLLNQNCIHICVDNIFRDFFARFPATRLMLAATVLVKVVWPEDPLGLSLAKLRWHACENKLSSLARSLLRLHLIFKCTSNDDQAA